MKNAKYGQLKSLSGHAHERLLEAKAIRQGQGGDNEHKDQCDSIPEVLDQSIHGIHLTPCYKHFTLIISRTKRKSMTEEGLVQQRCRPQRTSGAGILFPDYCYFCKQKRRKVKGEIQISHKLTLESAEDSIKKAAAEKEDEDVLRDIRDVDLRAKDFQVHDMCFLEYTRRRTSTDGEQTDGEHPGDIQAVKELINNVIIEGNKAISMAVIHELYDDGHVGDTRYRSRLKQRILDLYPDDLLFLTINGKTPQIVVSREGITKELPRNYQGITTNTKEYLLKASAKALRSEILEYEKSLPDLSWPPQIDVLKERNESIPSLVTNFLDILLKAPGHSNSVFT